MDFMERKICIRRLKEEDSDAISEIYSLITKKAVNADFKKLVQEHAQENEHEAPFVAELDGRVIGFMISYIVTLGFGAEKSAYIATMGIHPRFMGEGVGAGIAREVLSFYKALGITRVCTSVRWDSTDILSFFKTMGFERSSFINLKKDLDVL
ncbi:hypothetical protein DAMNIGENAA_25010 [Desulforhabdus amnigena]|jgi:predicted N-acetyltransferase YhbS|uniref:N-acetyltransferase domain-containing protein n=2 Tax=Desulforhabdus amnigena TaxID=40218 RepID=A0A9W6L7W3_9BACT|nr:hypothetical protein DAMNIGENAA_25010 [Desulforhabdus amnigena]